jgi:hypothetical protein
VESQNAPTIGLTLGNCHRVCVLRPKGFACGIGHVRLDVEDGQVVANRADALERSLDSRAAIEGGEDPAVRGGNRRTPAQPIQDAQPRALSDPRSLRAAGAEPDHVRREFEFRFPPLVQQLERQRELIEQRQAADGVCDFGPPAHHALHVSQQVPPAIGRLGGNFRVAATK